MDNTAQSVSQFKSTTISPIKASSKGKVHLVLLALCFFLLGLIVGVYFTKAGTQTNTQAQSENTVLLSIGSKAPDFTLSSFSGESVNLSQFQGKPVVVLFWGTWCFSCLENLSYAQKSYNDLGNKAVFLGIHMSDAESPARSALFTEKLSITYPLLKDIDGKVYASYKFSETMPLIYFIDKFGTIKNRIAGMVTEDLIKNTLQEMLNQ